MHFKKLGKIVANFQAVKHTFHSSLSLYKKTKTLGLETLQNDFKH